MNAPGPVAGNNDLHPNVQGPDQATANVLWKSLVIGLVVLTGLAGIGVIVTVATGRTNDAILTVFTTTLAALVGLFVKSPTQ